MKLKELFEIDPPIPSMLVTESEDDFRNVIWSRIETATNQVHLYSLLMNALIEWAKAYPEAPFLRHPEDLKLLEETTYDTDIDLEGGDKLPIRIGIVVNVELLENLLLDKMRALLTKMLDEPIDSTQVSTKQKILTLLTVRENELKDKLWINIGFNVVKWRELIQKFVEDLRLGDISEDLELIREARFKILGHISNQLSEDNSYLKELEQDWKTGIRKRFLERMGDLETFNKILETIGLDMNKRSKPIMSPAIVHFYSNKENFNTYILKEEAHEEHRILLQVVLDLLLANKKIKKELLDSVVARFRSKDARLNSYDNFLRDFQDFQIHPFHYNKLIDSLIQETESVLGLLHFTWANDWHEKFAGLAEHLPVVKLQRLEITPYNPERESNAAFENNQALIKGFSPLEYYPSDSDENQKYLGSFDGCEYFFVSQTGLDLQVFNPGFTHKFDFFNRTVFEKDENGVFIPFNYRDETKPLILMRSAITQVFSPENDVDENFKFSKKWKGVYHVRLGRKRSGGVRKRYFHTNIVTYRTGGGYGIGRADNIRSSEYLWTCNGDDEQQIKIAKWLKLDNARFIHEDYQYTSSHVTPGKFQHEFVSDAEDIKYVRVNLPYINTVRIKNEVSNEGIAILSALGIKYYRKVNKDFTVVKEDTKNYPHSDINLPVCFDIPDNYRFLHKFRDENGNRNGSKWLMRIQREKAQLGSPTGAKSDLNALKGGNSATDYARDRFTEQKYKEVEIWEKIKSPFESLPTLQEWCHLHGRGDGGPDVSNNLVAGSNHCNTEQAAIELAQRLTTQYSATAYFLRTTAYLFQEPEGTGVVVNTVKRNNSSVISQVQPTSHKQGKKRRREEDDDKKNPARKKRKTITQNPETSLAAFIRYRVYTRDGKNDVKLIDYTFEGQSEFFDMNQYRIVNSIVEYTLKGNATPWND